MAEHENRVRVRVEDGVADVRMVRGDKHNGIDAEMFAALNAALDQLNDEPDLRAVVLSGEGPSFCAGLDVQSFVATADEQPSKAFERRDGQLENYAQRVAHGWRSLPVPVIAAVHGNALGGGLQIALGADIRIAAPGTRMSVMEIRYGLIPDMGLSQTLPGLVRDDVARELTYTGRIVEADEAASLGLVTRVAEDPLAEARDLAAEIASKSPAAIRSGKRLLNQAPKLGASDGLGLEEELQKELIDSLAEMAAAAQPGD